MPKFFSQYQEQLFAIAVLLCGAAGLYIVHTAFTALQIFTLIVLIILLAASLVRPAMALLTIFVWLLLESPLIGQAPAEIFPLLRFFPEVVIYSLFAQVLYRRVVRGIPFHLPMRAIGWWFAGLIAIGVLSAAVNQVDPTVAASAIRQIVRFMPLIVITAHIPLTRSWYQAAFGLVVGLCIVQAGLGLLQYLSGGWLDQFLLPNIDVQFGNFVYSSVDQFWALGTRIFGTLGRYDRYGIAMVFWTLLWAALWIGRRFTVNPVPLPLLTTMQRLAPWFTLISATTVLLSSSRAAILALLVGGLWLLAIGFRQWKLFSLAIGLLASLGIVAGLYASAQGLVLRYIVDSPTAGLFERLIEPVSINSLVGNYYGYGRTFWLVETPRTVVASSPIFGVGPGQFGSGTAAQFNQTQTYTTLGLPFGAGDDIGVIDNSWFSFWGEFGTVGLLVLIGLFVALYRVAGAARGLESSPIGQLVRGAQAGIIAILLAAVFANHFEIRTTMVLLYLLPILLARWQQAAAALPQR